jgi:hypothetical protein
MFMAPGRALEVDALAAEAHQQPLGADRPGRWIAMSNM